MAKTKAKGKVSQKTPRAGKRRGVKLFGCQTAKTGNIIVRQKGTKFHPGEGCEKGRDFTIFATRNGTVVFKKKQGKNIVSVC